MDPLVSLQCLSHKIPTARERKVKEGEKDKDISPNACEYHFIDLK